MDEKPRPEILQMDDTKKTSKMQSPQTKAADLNVKTEKSTT